MHIGILSHPMLFKTDSELQQQVRAAIHALRHAGQADGAMTVSLIDPQRPHLSAYDLIHVFSASHGNHRVIEDAAAQGVPVVLSPLTSPGWNGAAGDSARSGDDGLGRLTGWNVETGYAQTRRSLQLASLIVTLGDAEKQALADGFLVDSAKVRVFPKGIGARFFSANGELFRLRTGIAGPFALMVGAISPYNDPLGMAHTLAELALPLVLVGAARERDQDYLRQVRAVRGVTCLGGLQHDSLMLASAYAAASVFLLPGQGAHCPSQAFEALAAGTPVVMSSDGAPGLPGSEFALARVRRDDGSARKHAIALLAATAQGGEQLRLPGRERIRALVRGHTWEHVADQIVRCYKEVLAGRRRTEASIAMAQAFLG